MTTSLYFFLASILAVNAQSAFPGDNGLPSPPSASTPLGNTAVWQEAVTLDAASNLTSGVNNRYVYSSVAWWQSLENSSNSYLSGSADPDAGPWMSQLVQHLQMYPTRFDQAQASDPEQTSSK